MDRTNELQYTFSLFVNSIQTLFIRLSTNALPIQFENEQNYKIIGNGNLFFLWLR